MRRILILLCAATLVACTSTAPRFEADPTVDLTLLDRFAWQTLSRTAAPAHPLDSEILDKRLRVSATAALTERGFHVDDSAPQFHLRSRLVIAAKAKDAPRVSVGIGVGSYGGSSAGSVSIGGSTAVGEARDGVTLALEVRDAATDALLWQGWREVSDAIGDPAKPALDAAVRAILADFPAPTSKSANKKR